MTGTDERKHLATCPACGRPSITTDVRTGKCWTCCFPDDFRWLYGAAKRS